VRRFTIQMNYEKWEKKPHPLRKQGFRRKYCNSPLLKNAPSQITTLNISIPKTIEIPRPKPNAKPVEKERRMPASSKNKVIPYPKSPTDTSINIKTIIQECDTPRLKAMIAVQYALACRAGEIIHYLHRYVPKDPGEKALKKRMGVVETVGLLKENISVMEGERENIWVCHVPNFKNAGTTWKDPYILEKSEPWIFQPFKQRYDACSSKLFNLHISHYRCLVDNHLKKYDSGWSTHCLRHSRATHLVNEFGFSAYELQEFLGHAWLTTSATYVKKDLKRSADKISTKLLKGGVV